MQLKRILTGLLIAAFSIGALAQVNSVPMVGLSDSSGAKYANTEGVKATYSAAVTGLVAASSATDVFYITGSATKTIRITRINIGGRATSAAAADVELIKRSAANSAGTCTAATAVPHDSASGAATAVVSSCTANPTTGAAVGAIRQKQLFLGNLTTGAPGADSTFMFGDRPAQEPVLRGATQVIAVNLNGVTYSGNLLDVDIEWTEE